MSTLSDLPTEVFCTILQYLPPKSWAVLTLTAKCFDLQLADDYLWRSLCPSTLSSPAPYGNWRTAYALLFARYGWLLGLWHGDTQWLGDLSQCTYNEMSGNIDCYRLEPLAIFRSPVTYSYDQNTLWRDFRVGLRTWSLPTFSLGPYADQEQTRVSVHRVRAFDMDLLREGSDPQYVRERTDLEGLWPSLLMPSKDHTGHKRYGFGLKEDYSHDLFVLRRPIFDTVSLVLPGQMSHHLEYMSRIPSPPIPGPGPEDCTGLWIGDYSSHGPEILYLYYPTPTSLHAVKITGDPNVPRGQFSWIVDNLATHRICQEDEWPGARAVLGRGQISPHGYSAPTWIEVEIIFHDDGIALWWKEMLHMFVFHLTCTDLTYSSMLHKMPLEGLPPY